MRTSVTINGGTVSADGSMTVSPTSMTPLTSLRSYRRGRAGWTRERDCDGRLKPPDPAPQRFELHGERYLRLIRGIR